MKRDIKIYYEVVFWFFLLLCIFINILLLRGYLYKGYGIPSDDTYYILLAKSLSSGFGYSKIFTPGLPHEVQYPPFFPLLLSFITYFWGYNFLHMYILNLVLGIASLYAIKLLFQETADRVAALLITIFVATNPTILYMMQMILSEIPYLCFSIITLYLVLLYSKQDKVFNWLLLLLILFISFTYLTRTIGVSIWIASVVYFFVLYFSHESKYKNKKVILSKLLAVGCLGAMPFILWYVRNHYMTGITSTYFGVFLYIDPYNHNKGTLDIIGLFNRIWSNIHLYKDIVFNSIVVLQENTLNNLIYLLLSIIAFMGYVRSLILKKSVIEIYVLIYLSIILIWPFKEATRFFMPLIPFLYYFFYLGLKGAVEVVLRSEQLIRYRNAVITIIILPIPFLNMWSFSNAHNISQISSIKANMYFSKDSIVKNLLRKVNQVEPELIFGNRFLIHPSLYRYFMISFKLRELTTKDNIIVARKPSLTALISDRYVVGFPRLSNNEKMIAYFDRKNVNYILLDEIFASTRQYIDPVIESNPSKFIPIYKDGYSYIIKYPQK